MTTQARSKYGLLLVLTITVFVVGCAAQVAGNLDEAAANRLIVALDRGGIAASKEADARFDGRMVVTVSRQDEAHAVALLAEQGLPAEEPPSILNALGDDTLVLSANAEQAKLLSGIAGELQRSLSTIDGVLSARVHLAADLPSAINDGAPLGSRRASVLLRHRGEIPPISKTDIQRLVSGAVPGITTDSVEVVTVSSPPSDDSGDRLTRIGPIGVASGSLTLFKGFVVTLALLNLLLIGVIAVLWLKLRRHRPVPEPSRASAVLLPDADEAR